MAGDQASVNRRDFLKALAGGAAAASLPAWAFAKAAGDRPNFVVIFTDDQGYQDVGCFGAPKIKTPNLDRMAAEGMKFTDFYVAASVCSPSRAALLTGCYPTPTGVTRVLFPRDKTGLKPGMKTIADVLKTRGYATTCIGKWHLVHKPPHLPTFHGFDSYFGIPYSNDMRPTPLMRNTETVEEPANQATLTQRYTEEAVAFLKANKDKPFFLYVPHTMPHVPLAASETFKGRSAGGLYGDVIEEIDWSTGEILKTLKELGVDSKTLVIYTSDNGPWLSKKAHGGCSLPLRDGKFSTYEGGFREPCSMRWPGTIPARGLRRDGPDDGLPADVCETRRRRPARRLRTQRQGHLGVDDPARRQDAARCVLLLPRHDARGRPLRQVEGHPLHQGRRRPTRPAAPTL